MTGLLLALFTPVAGLAQADPPVAGMALTFSYAPASKGLMLATGGPTDAGYAAQIAAHPSTMIWQPRYIPQGTDPKGGSDIYSGQYQLNVDPAYPWSNHFTPFSIDGYGNLVIQARATASVSPSFVQGEVNTRPGTSTPYPYVSGLLSSKNAFSQQGGFFEIQAEVPTGSAFWPALWLMPKGETHPPELDIVEHVGGYDPPTVYRTTSFGIGQQPVQIHVSAGTNLGTGMHRYGLGWTDTTLTQYFDDKVVGTRDISQNPEFAQPFYILMGLQVGSTLANWVSAPNGATSPYENLDIKSVQVWQYPGPVSVNLSASSYLDNLPIGGTVATIAVTNFGGNANYTFSKLLDPDRMFAISGNKLILTRVDSASLASSHQLVLKVTDGAGRSRQRLFTIGVVPATPAQANYVTHQALNSGFWLGSRMTISSATTGLELPLTGYHQLGNALTIFRAAGTKSYMSWVEAAASLTRTEVYLQVFNAAWTSQAFAFFNLKTGLVDYAATAGAFSANVPFITPLANGGYRCGFRFTTDASSTGFQFIAGTALSTAATQFLGIAGDGIVISNPWLFNLDALSAAY